jgi:hypothetical protein
MDDSPADNLSGDYYPHQVRWFWSKMWVSVVDASRGADTLHPDFHATTCVLSKMQGPIWARRGTASTPAFVSPTLLDLLPIRTLYLEGTP